MTTPASISRPDIGRWTPSVMVGVKQVGEVVTPPTPPWHI